MTAAKKQVFEEMGLDSDRAGYDVISRFLHDKTGIHLPYNEKNKTLVASRLQSTIKKYGLNGYKEYFKFLQNGNASAVNEFISRMTTNTTQFFRENQHFEFFSKWLPGSLQSKVRSQDVDYRVWCAASSTGQEPYTILMNLFESGFANYNMSLKMLATDIDLDVLKKASEGLYTDQEVKDVPKHLLIKYFDKLNESRIEKKPVRNLQIKSEYSELIRFAKLNLLETPYPFAFKFDVIFCRNVLIYFRDQEIQRVVRSMVDALKPDGLLFVGHSESGTIRDSRLKSVSHAVYKKVR